MKSPIAVSGKGARALEVAVRRCVEVAAEVVVTAVAVQNGSCSSETVVALNRKLRFGAEVVVRKGSWFETEVLGRNTVRGVNGVPWKAKPRAGESPIPRRGVFLFTCPGGPGFSRLVSTSDTRPAAAI